MATKTHTMAAAIVPDAEPMPGFLRTLIVSRMVGVDGSTLWRWEQAGRFPRRIRLSARCSVYDRQAVLDWIKQQGNQG